MHPFLFSIVGALRQFIREAKDAETRESLTVLYNACRAVNAEAAKITEAFKGITADPFSKSALDDAAKAIFPDGIPDEMKTPVVVKAPPVEGSDAPAPVVVAPPA